MFARQSGRQPLCERPVGLSSSSFLDEERAATSYMPDFLIQVLASSTTDRFNDVLDLGAFEAKCAGTLPELAFVSSASTFPS